MTERSVDSGTGAPRALVTGASSGIGEAVTARLAGSGFDVLAVSRRRYRNTPNDERGGRSETAGSTVEGTVTSMQVDLADLDSLPEKAEELVKASSRLEVIVLAAGKGRFGSLEQLSPPQIREVIDLNLTANLLLCRALVPVLKTRGKGKVIFVGSEAGLQGKRQGSVYCASKFGLRGLAQALRDECAGSGVAVSLIQPGMVRTPFFDEQHFEPGPDTSHALTADDVAAAVQYVVAGPAHAVVDELDLSPLQHVVRKKK